MPTMAKSPYSRKLKALRERLGQADGRDEITQREAAARLGVTLRAWTKWETDGELPSPAYAKLLEQFIKHPEDFPAPKTLPEN